MRHIEETMQIHCVKWFEDQYPNLAMLLHHSPNGGARNPREGARFKAMGTRKGYPDLSLHMARGGFYGLFVEMKSDKGRQEDSQKIQQRLLENQGYKYALCRSFEEFQIIIKTYLQI